MSSDSMFLSVLPHIGTLLSLAFLFVLTSLWLKSTVRGFGLMALAEVLDLASRGVSSFVVARGMDYQYVSLFWLAGGVVRLIGAYLLYKHYLDPVADGESTESADTAQ